MGSEFSGEKSRVWRVGAVTGSDMGVMDSVFIGVKKMLESVRKC